MIRGLLIAGPSVVASQDYPRLSQAWQANSIGDGLPNTTGLESYIYEDCSVHNETCMRGHVFNYGADTCVKYEVDMGVHSKYSGTYYVKCKGGLNCCRKGGEKRPPSVKQWQIGLTNTANITYVGALDIHNLDGPVRADAWNEIFKLPYTNVKVNYTYYVTHSGDDIISHRIDYSAPGDTDVQAGQILYGNFIAKHAEELDAFRDVFKAPDECTHKSVMTCPGSEVEEWESKFFQQALVV